MYRTTSVIRNPETTVRNATQQSSGGGGGIPKGLSVSYPTGAV